MRETERQISIYKQQLSKMRERLFAALTILVVAAVMAVSSTFAWLVLSQSPEIKGINTTVTSNGNLEIALAKGTEITEPADSEVGDSGKNLVEKNTTWGNLVNLGDPAYGLENVVLRPATINKNDLLGQPLFGASYGNDGRVESLVSNFAYAYWNQDIFSADMVKYGVRTVSSVTYGPAPGQNIALADAVENTNKEIISVANELVTLSNDPAIQNLVSIMGAYVDAQIEEVAGDEPFIYVTADQVESIYYLMSEFKKNIEHAADALASVYNLEMLRVIDNEYLLNNKFSGDYLLTAKQADINTKLAAKVGTQIAVSPIMKDFLWTLRKDYNTIKSDLEIIGTYRGRDDVVYRNLNGSTYPAIETYVNHIVVVGTTEINDSPINKLGDNIFSLLGGGTKKVVITEGIFFNMVKFTGADIKVENIEVTVMNNTQSAVITVAAKAPFVLPAEFEDALAGDTSYKGTNPIAGDTYGMALDFFFRTNASNSHLILQGSPEYEEREETVSATIDGQKYTLYKVTVNGEEKIVYLNNTNSKYYTYDRDTQSSGASVGTTETITNATVLTEKVKYVVGYSGVNRVWDSTESEILDDNSTTQGAGSCYVFYSTSPEDQEKALQLLEHFSIAFIDQNGTFLGEAYLDTKNKLEQTGKVVVPLVLSVTNNSVINDKGETIQTITELNPNEATFITALVYLDGVGLTNDQVLAAGEIQGQLNIQFGTTADLDAMNDPTLMESKCIVTATMAGANKVTNDSSLADRNKTVTVTVDGYEPSKVEAYFLREINNTQGIRQGKITFEPNANGDWEGSYQFTSPGKYVLREVILDGVTYELDSDSITFTVEGFAITSVLCNDNGKTYITTNKSFDTSVSLNFATDDPTKMPGSVKGAFIHKETGNRTTVYFSNINGATWSGNATFTTSGEYILDYVELDGQYTGLEESQFVSIDLMLGLTASVYTGESNFALEDGESRNVDMSLVIKNDAGEIIGGFTDVWMQFSNNGSGTQEIGLGAGMAWNASRQRYEGTFKIEEAGIYTYDYVDIKLKDGQGNINHNYLNSAIVSPKITAISSTPPRYVSKSGFGDVFSLNNDAEFTITMKNAKSATVDAVLKNEADETYYVRGVMTEHGTEQDFTFVIPVVEGSQKGTWTLEKLYMTNIYGGPENILYNGSIENGPDTATDEKPLYTVSDNYYFRWLPWKLDELTNDSETDESRAATITVTGVSDINVSLSSSTLNSKKIFGKTGDTVTATFGTTHTLGDLELLITVGNEAKPLSDYGLSATKVNLAYAYDQSSVTKDTVVTNLFGGYTTTVADWTKIAPPSATYVYDTIAVNGSDSTLYTISPNSNNKTISVAGRYMAPGSLTITLQSENGNTGTVTKSASALGMPVVEVYSSAPTAKFISTDPAVGTEFNAINDAQDGTIKVANSIENNGLELTCYFEAKQSGCDCDGFTASKATAELEGLGSSYKSASFTIISKGTASNVVFSFTPASSGNPTNQQAIGQGGDEPKYIGEDVQVTQIVVTDANDYIYTFNLPADKILYVTCNR